MNRRKGFKRLVIVLGVPWYSLWALLAWGNYSNIEPNRKAAAEASAAGNWELALAHDTAVSSCYDRIFYAALATIIGPLLVWIVFLLARWIYRGFKSKMEASDA